MSAQALADATGLTRSIITNIENGRRETVTLAELESISIALGVPPIALALPVDRPFDWVRTGDLNVSVLGLMSWWSGDVTLRDRTKAGIQASRLIQWGEQLGAQRASIQRDLDEAFHVADELQRARIVAALTRDDPVANFISDGTGAVLLEHVDESRRAYRVIAEQFELIGGVPPEVDPVAQWLQRRVAGKDG